MKLNKEICKKCAKEYKYPFSLDCISGEECPLIGFKGFNYNCKYFKKHFVEKDDPFPDGKDVGLNIKICEKCTLGEDNSSIFKSIICNCIARTCFYTGKSSDFNLIRISDIKKEECPFYMEHIMNYKEEISNKEKFDIFKKFRLFRAKEDPPEIDIGLPDFFDFDPEDAWKKNEIEPQ